MLLCYLVTSTFLQHHNVKERNVCFENQSYNKTCPKTIHEKVAHDYNYTVFFISYPFGEN